MHSVQDFLCVLTDQIFGCNDDEDVSQQQELIYGQGKALEGKGNEGGKCL